MTIRIQNLSINPTTVGGISPGSQSNQFKDVFNRANSGNIGSTWASTYVATGAVGSQPNPSINANTLLFTNPGAGSCRTMIYPLPLSWMTQVVRNHFAETTITVVPAAFGVELAVVMQPQVSAGIVNVGFYCLIWDGGITTMKIQKAIWQGNNAAPAFTTLLDTGVTAVAGDVFRLEARNSAGTWSLTAKHNGTSIGTTTDNSLIQGMPGLEIALAGAVSLTCTEFAAGTI